MAEKGSGNSAPTTTASHRYVEDFVFSRMAVPFGCDLSSYKKPLNHPILFGNETPISEEIRGQPGRFRKRFVLDLR
jgi:hypothetical protein